ncbi:hypothetical protein EYF80_025415 [Liparis tanakae]|uniref:Uncharacterized protein n=1 Tax=Liparis tanakae TaxID=230148 RepID=A0A4Z2HHK0_9TELE|nr:hypothetical protein EYF80_025415 [Liparis tanakae]
MLRASLFSESREKMRARERAAGQLPLDELPHRPKVRVWAGHPQDDGVAVAEPDGGMQRSTFSFHGTSEDGVELEVLSAGQQVVDGVKLRAVAHVLMHLIDLRLDTEVSLSAGDHRVSGQHFKDAGFPCPIHPQQTEALQQKRDADVRVSSSTEDPLSLSGHVLVFFSNGLQLQYECGDAAVDPDQYVDAGENHVGRAGDLEEERGWVHQRGDGPSGGRNKKIILDEQR